ncbi:hypothetical protein BRARA_I00614 [Brassica rapa]|uniref:DUF7046 domain-containing protein n=1 Tax=Brassica campestris TaxID=3711 RepID=A0A397XRE7_BRACM|nr:hypothetical protein BRARA_I00614 [Brassica rapa]
MLALSKGVENGHVERLAVRFSQVGVEDSSRLLEKDFKNDNLLLVIKAVEAAETTIKHQVDENSRLKAELQRSTLELARYKSDESLLQTSNPGDHSNTTTVSSLAHRPVEREETVIKASDADSLGMVVVHNHVNSNGEEATVSNRFQSPSEQNMVNGIVKGASPSLMRTQLEGAHVTHFNLSTHGFMPVGEVNDSDNAWKQDLIHKVHENEQRILHLRRYLTDCSVKEAQTRNEKYILEKRMAYMRQAFDQQQEDLVVAASKALSYRQEIIEENIRLTYALQATQQEKSTFVSYLLPLLSEYSLQPQVSDAQSIDSLYDQTAMEWDSKRWHQDEPGSSTMSSFQFDDSRRFSPLVNGHFPGFEMPQQQPGTTSEDESRGWKQVEDTPAKHVQFLEPLSKIVMEDAKGESDNTKNSPYVPAFDDPPSSSNSPLLSPVLEEPSSSSDEDEDDDPLPAIEDLQISGEPYPGHELQACGYSINGTTSCNFEWVCHLEDGSVNYIDGAKQPNYLVTADDVDLYLAIEVQPLDDRNRKGQLVKVFANENRKIACHPEMQSHIEKTLHSGHASYKVSVSTGFLNIWEEAMLSIKREGYSIKCSNDIMVAEKFSSSTSVTIPFGQPEEFVITGSNGTEYTLRGDHGSADLCCSRDAIVLTLRLFTMRALQRKKGKKKGFLFNK